MNCPNCYYSLQYLFLNYCAVETADRQKWQGCENNGKSHRSQSF